MILIYYYSKGKWWHIKIIVREKKGKSYRPTYKYYHLMHPTTKGADKPYYKKDLRDKC